MPSMRPFMETGHLSSGRATFAPQPSDHVNAAVLAAATSENQAIPAGAVFVAFGADAIFYAKFGIAGVTAAIPSGDITDGTAPEVNPSVRRIPAGVTHVALISTTAQVVTLSYFGG